MAQPRAPRDPRKSRAIALRRGGADSRRV